MQNTAAEFREKVANNTLTEDVPDDVIIVSVIGQTGVQKYMVAILFQIQNMFIYIIMLLPAF